MSNAPKPRSRRRRLHGNQRVACNEAIARYSDMNCQERQRISRIVHLMRRVTARKGAMLTTNELEAFHERLTPDDRAIIRFVHGIRHDVMVSFVAQCRRHYANRTKFAALVNAIEARLMPTAAIAATTA